MTEMPGSANTIINAAYVRADHPLRLDIQRVLRHPPSCPTVEFAPGQVEAIASDILNAMSEIDLGDVPSVALRAEVERLKRENDGLILALARTVG